VTLLQKVQTETGASQREQAQTKPVGFWEAFWLWVKLGFMNFGGPAGQIAIMHRELVGRKRWVSEGQYLRTLDFCLLLPGPERSRSLLTSMPGRENGPRSRALSPRGRGRAAFPGLVDPVVRRAHRPCARARPAVFGFVSCGASHDVRVVTLRGRSRVGMLYALIFWVIVGLIAGALARAIMPGDDPGGILVTIIIGIVGAVIGGWLLSFLGLGGAATGAWIWSIISGIIGAVILLAIYRALAGRRV
jgi:uncharacterized membrane protein YeaQ/YmgE (transglycosylase-associated protein family)